MRKIFLFLSLFLVVLLLSPTVFARSGCCSHHGGVCGCGCCDGTSLSSTCAPYYPECSGGRSQQPVYVAPTSVPYIPPATSTPYIPPPTATPILPTITPTNIPILTPTIIPTKNVLGVEANTPTPTIAVQSSGSNAGGILGLLVLAGGGYWLYKRRKSQPTTQGPTV